ncbi:hypothetical protein COO60DRAFT_1185975 [Scenedesmus sp. NREL 46B-D3]|nr:hypothetical protein COO60DRAFT_1185975 [Scenedesmus sp. NREL 46B-D3]
MQLLRAALDRCGRTPAAAPAVLDAAAARLKLLVSQCSIVLSQHSTATGFSMIYALNAGHRVAERSNPQAHTALRACAACRGIADQPSMLPPPASPNDLRCRPARAFFRWITSVWTSNARVCGRCSSTQQCLLWPCLAVRAARCTARPGFCAAAEACREAACAYDQAGHPGATAAQQQRVQEGLSGSARCRQR